MYGIERKEKCNKLEFHKQCMDIHSAPFPHVEFCVQAHVKFHYLHGFPRLKNLSVFLHEVEFHLEFAFGVEFHVWRRFPRTDGQLHI